MPQDVNPGDKPADLTPDDLDGVSGGTFHTEFEAGSELNISQGAGKLQQTPEMSLACLNPQPLPP